MVVKQDGILSGHSATDSLAVLDNEHRRAVVGILADKEEDRSVSLSSLAEGVVAEMQGVEGDVERLEIELHHNHLPKLDEAGVLEYWPEAQYVISTDGLTAAERLVETAARN